ncbi:hypothetical protein FRC07_014340 [Ceratobasidium sp. 392]|nr:hypothetical protein FRC07_014340 [Ceratobasidium sp. 392]
MTPQAQLDAPAPGNIQEAGIIEDEPSSPIKEEPNKEPSFSGPQKPIPSIIKNMDDTGTIYLLMFIAHWIRKSLENISSTSPPHPLLDTSLRSEEISHLRELARACIAAIREDLDLEGSVEVEVDTSVFPAKNHDDEPIPAKPDSARYAHLIGTWMVVGAIASVWGQRDMWEHAEEILGELVIAKPRALVPKASTSAARPASTSGAIPPDRPDPELDVVLNYG